MANPCAIFIDDPKLAKKLGVEVGKRLTYVEFAEKVSEGLLDDIADIGGGEPPVEPKKPSSDGQGQPPFEGFRKKVISEVQNTYKDAPKGLIQLAVEGLSKLKLYKGESIFDATERVATNLLDRISRKENVALNTSETAQVQYYFFALKKQAFDIANSDRTFAEKQAKLAEIKVKTDNAEKIWGAVGQEQARAMVMRQIEGSMTPGQKLEMKKMEFYTESGVDPKELSQKQLDETDAKIKKIHEESEAKQKELAEEYETKLKEQAEKHLAEIEKGKKVSGITVEKPKQSFVERASKKLTDNPKLREIFNNKDRSQEIIEKVDKGRKEGKSIDEIVDELVDSKEISETNAPKVKKFFREQEVEMAKEAGKIDNDMLRETVQKIIDSGVDRKDIGIDEIVSRLKEDYFTDFTDKQIRDMITDYGKTKVLNEDPIASTIKYAKDVANLLSQIDELENQILPKRKTEIRKDLSPAEIAAKKAEISELRKQVHGLMKNLPIDEATKANQLKTAQDRISSFLENSILQLEKQIKDGVKTVINKKTVVYNEANKALLEKLNAVRAEFNNKFPKAEISIEERIRRAVKGIEKSERNYERRIAEREFTTTPKTELTSPEIEIAKAKRDLRKAEFEKLKKESVPVVDAKVELFGNISEMAEKQGATTFTNEMVKEGYVDALVKQKIEEGLKGEEVFKQIKEDLKNVLPDLTESDIHKAVLKIDEFKQQTKQEVENANKKAQQEVGKLAKIKNDINNIIEFGKLIKNKVITKVEASQAIKDEQLRKKAWEAELKESENANKEYKRQLEIEKAKAEKLRKKTEQFEALEAKAANKQMLRAEIAKAKEEIAKDAKRIVDLEKKIAQRQAKVQELNEKIANANGRQQMWEKVQKNPKAVDEYLAEKRKQLRETLNANGLSPENENITNRKKITEIAKNLSDAISKFKSELADNKDLKDVADALSLSNYKSAEKKGDLLRKDKRLVENIAIDLASKGFKAESSKLYEILHNINEQEKLAKEQKASDNFIKNTERSIGKNTRELVQGKFEETNTPVPLLNAQSIKIKAAKDASDRAFRVEQERFQRANMNKAKKFASDYTGWIRRGLVSGLTPLSKIGLSSVVRPIAETYTRFAFNKVISRIIMPNLSKVQRNEGFYKRATQAAHALGNAFKTEADVKTLRESVENDFNDAKIAYDKDPSDTNKERLNIATREFAYSSVFDFIQANSWGEFADMIAGRQTRLQEVFGIDKGKMWDEVKGAYEVSEFMMDTFGRLHGAMKNFSGRAEFMRAFMTNIQNDMIRGEDPLTIDNTMIYALQGLKASKEGTYQKDIITTTAINSLIQKLQSNKKQKINNDVVMAEFGALIVRVNYPIMKTPLNIWKEFVFDYVLGVPISAGKQMLNFGGEWQQASKEMQTNSFKEKWAKVSERLGQTEDSDFVDELSAGYRRGLTGALVMGLAGLGKAVLDDDDEWTIFGIHFGKKESSAISHLSVMMPAEVIEKFKEAKEKAIENEDESPNYKAWKEASKFILKQNVFFNDYEPSEGASIAVLIPNIRAYGDYRKMTEGQRKSTTALDYLKTTSGLFAGDVPLKESAQSKYKVSTEDLANPKVAEFKKSETFKDIPASYQEEAIARYAKKIKDINELQKKQPSTQKVLQENYKDAMYDVADEIENNIYAKEQESTLVENVKKAMTLNKKVEAFENALVGKDGLLISKSARIKKLEKWQKEGLLAKNVRDAIDEKIKNVYKQ